MTPYPTYQTRVVSLVCLPWKDDVLCHIIAKHIFYSTIYISKYAASYTTLLTNGFTGKERDAETGYGYFGARYMDHELMTMWLSVDPMAGKYPSISPYAYCAWNPVKLEDPNGMEISPIFSTNGKLLGTDDKGYSGRAIVMDQKAFEEGMSHAKAESVGQYLDKYGEGISIAEEDWDKVVRYGGSKLSPFVSNQSNHTIYYKPEGIKEGINQNPGYSSSGAYPIPAHTDLYAQTDGIAAPHLKQDNVFKMPDELRIIVDNRDVSMTSSLNLRTRCLYYMNIRSGWRGESWHNHLISTCVSIPTVSFSVEISKQSDRSWDSLFKRSQR